MNDKSAKPIDMMTLKQLCAEIKVDPREDCDSQFVTPRSIPSSRSRTSQDTYGSGRKIDRTEGGQYGPDCQLLTFTQLCPLWHRLCCKSRRHASSTQQSNQRRPLVESILRCPLNP
jgi:hypothetical protein